MNKRHLALSIIATITVVAILFSACRKINEATELGGDVIPPVDGITTFDTLITVEAFQDTFGLANDSQYLAKGEEFFLGKITNDPFFGQTDARIFLELKPPTFPFFFANKPDSLTLDSVVLVLDYVETYGDTNALQTVNVYELDQSNNFRSDTAYLIRKNEFTYSALLGSKTFAPKILNDSIKTFLDSSKNQLRIRLDNSFGNRLLGYDSSGNGAYKTDSLFRTRFKGFALQSVSSGNAIMGFDLTGINTHLAVYYKFEKRVQPNVPQPDTAISYFLFSSNTAAANYVKREYAGSPVMTYINNAPATPDPFIYIQNSPGTFATIKIPALANLSNRVIHRAELIMEEVYDLSDSTFPPPLIMYLDAIDPSIAAPRKPFRTIPYDFDVLSTGEFPYGYFGITPVTAPDGLGNTVRVWKLNISRYVQNYLTRKVPLYDLRLYSPFQMRSSVTRTAGTTTDIPVPGGVILNPTIATGRVRFFGNNGPSDTNPRRLRLRLVYSKL